MGKTILITGSTDGIGRHTAEILVRQGHHVILHGRNPAKLEDVRQALDGLGSVTTEQADLSRLAEVEALAERLSQAHDHLDVLVNNAGVFNSAQPRTEDGLDIRFAVNTFAPFILTRKLLSLLGPSGRVVNLSSAAQTPVDLHALQNQVSMAHGSAYAQSKLALTMWTRHLAQVRGDEGPVLVAVNPGSLLGTKMVQEAFGMAGGDVGIGAEILRRAALDDDFANASGLYFDNDAGRFGPPHRDALNDAKNAALVDAMEATLDRLGLG